MSELPVATASFGPLSQAPGTAPSAPMTDGSCDREGPWAAGTDPAGGRPYVWEMDTHMPFPAPTLPGIDQMLNAERGEEGAREREAGIPCDDSEPCLPLAAGR